MFKVTETASVVENGARAEEEVEYVTIVAERELAKTEDVGQMIAWCRKPGTKVRRCGSCMTFTGSCR